MKIEWLNTNMTAIGSPAKAESEIFWVVLGVFLPIWAAIVVGEPLCELETPSWVLRTLLRIIWWKYVEWLVITIVVLNPRYTWHCHRIASNCPGLPWYSLRFCVTEIRLPREPCKNNTMDSKHHAPVGERECECWECLCVGRVSLGYLELLAKHVRLLCPKPFEGASSLFPKKAILYFIVVIFLLSSPALGMNFLKNGSNLGMRAKPFPSRDSSLYSFHGILPQNTLLSLRKSVISSALHPGLLMPCINLK